MWTGRRSSHEPLGRPEAKMAPSGGSEAWGSLITVPAMLALLPRNIATTSPRWLLTFMS